MEHRRRLNRRFRAAPARPPKSAGEMKDEI
jgi:hypothetical protein